ncbi:archease [Nanoarchaeota archaeon]|nr:MAG: archease [Nanoarchaeota archaeon]
MPFRYLPHTADAEFIAEGNSWEEVFSESAKAMLSIMCDLKRVEGKIEKEIELKAKSREDLLHDFLDELLYIFETENLIFKEFKLEIEDTRLRCKCYGERFDPKKHEAGGLVKAVTYHNLKTWEERGKKFARVVLDL